MDRHLCSATKCIVSFQFSDDHRFIQWSEAKENEESPFWRIHSEEEPHACASLFLSQGLEVQSRGHQGKLSQNVSGHVHFVLGNHKSPLHVFKGVTLTHQLGNLGVYILGLHAVGFAWLDVWRNLPGQWLGRPCRGL